MQRVPVHLDDADLGLLDALAKRHGWSRTDMIRWLIRYGAVMTGLRLPRPLNAFLGRKPRSLKPVD